MDTAATVAQWVLRVGGIVQLLGGLVLWTDSAPGLVNPHMLVGLLVVVSLWVLAAVGARAGARAPLVGLAAVWGLITVVLGITQTGLLVGSAHWVIEVAHLLVGLVALGLGEALAGRTKRARPATAMS